MHRQFFLSKRIFGLSSLYLLTVTSCRYPFWSSEFQSIGFRSNWCPGCEAFRFYLQYMIYQLLFIVYTCMAYGGYNKAFKDRYCPPSLFTILVPTLTIRPCIEYETKFLYRDKDKMPLSISLYPLNCTVYLCPLSSPFFVLPFAYFPCSFPLTLSLILFTSLHLTIYPHTL